MRILIDDDPISKGLDIKEFDIVITSFYAGARFIDRIFPMDEVYFDHDLNSLNERYTGYLLMKNLLEIVFPQKIVLVTNNPIGRQNMHNLLKEHGYSHKGDYEYLKREV